MSKLQVTLGELNNVDGSARLSVGSTKVVVSVTGPIEPKIRQELPTQASLEIIVRPSRGLSGTREKTLEDLLRLVLQAVIVRFKYPRQLIQIVVQFLASDLDKDESSSETGGRFNTGASYMTNELSAAINCCYFALADANVALHTSFAATSIAIDENNAPVFNAELPVLKKSLSHHTVCFDIQEKKASKILLVESNGAFSEEQLLSTIQSASVECERIHSEVQRLVLEKKIDADYIWSK
ncbi:hypothetical protein PUMCH_000512 [Australozyma saopauloensis]|uniref:Exoribonuclease phosphorolytic domain-containing protein n=1 Tax=Australozyma saopauloensis TaxID=291208 RepID=A0AAX4H5M5_9ASCO|nr:hypothetical protein PUMCH_000512 [[Candida] saopauloensis]